MPPLMRPVLTAWLLFMAGPALGDEPCRLVPDSDQAVTIGLAVTDPDGTLVAGATVVVDHPEGKIGIVGEGITLPKTTIAGQPPDAVTSANDLGDAVRVVIARAGPLPTNAPLFTLHFQRCAGTPAVVAGDISCKVIDASDPSANKIRGVGCTVTIP